MIVTYKDLDSYLNTANNYNRKSFANTLNSLVDIVYFIEVEIEALFVSYNMI